MERRKRAGLAAVQLLVVVLLVGAAACCFYFYVNSKAESNKRVVTIQRLGAVQTALEKYCVDCGGGLPTASQGLAALCSKPTARPVPAGWRGPYLRDRAALQDGWGRPLKYICPGHAVEPGSGRYHPYDLASYGRDGCEGGRGLDRDICNWDRSTLLP